MDRGRQGDDGPDDVEIAAVRDTVDLTAEAGGPSEAVPRVESEADATTEEADDRPAAWLADIRARAPWVLEPGGALHGSTTRRQGPAEVPHGSPSPGLSFDAAETVHPPRPNRLDAASPLRPWPEQTLGEDQPVNHTTAGGEGPPAAAAGGPRGLEIGAIGSEAVRHPPEPPAVPEPTAVPAPPTVPAPIGETGRILGRPTDPPVPPATTDGTVPSSGVPPWPAVGETQPTASESVAPEPVVREDGPLAPPSQPWPGPDSRRPAIHRTSATWPPPPAQAAAWTPVWPARPHPEGAGLPRPGPVPEPSRPMDRPVTPFVSDRPRPASPTGRHVAPSWADDRTGWHPAAVPAARIVDGSALPPWPSLLDDDDGDDGGPDVTVLERSFDRKRRLDHEQRRR